MNGLSKAPYDSAYNQSFITLVDHVRAPYSAQKSLRAPHERLRLITVGLHTSVHKPVRHPQGPVRCLHVQVIVQILTIPRNTDNPQNARMHVTMYIEEGPMRMSCVLWNTRAISGAGPYGVRCDPRLHARVIFTKLAKHDY